MKDQPRSTRISRILAVGGVVCAIAAGAIWANSALGAGTALPIACPPGVPIVLQPGDAGDSGTWACTPQPIPSTVTSTVTTPVPTIVPTTVTTTVTVTAPPPSPTNSPSPSPSASPSPTSSPTPTPTPPGPTGTCSAPANTPGGADPWGGCWPGPGNTGVPGGIAAGSALPLYAGPCTITTAGSIIDGRRVTCATLTIRATGVIIRNSFLDGVDVTNAGAAGSTFTIQDTTVRNGARDQCLCIGTHDFIARRVEVIGGNRSMYCASNCVIEDSWLHGQQLQGAQHGSGLREEQYTQATHNAIACDFPYADDQTSLGCSAALTGYPDFAPIHHNTIRRNLFLASPMASFCVYGGATSGKPYSGNAANGTYQRFEENIFQRGNRNVCAYYGPVTDYAAGRVGNVWSLNRYTDGTPINA